VYRMISVNPTYFVITNRTEGVRVYVSDISVKRITVTFSRGLLKTNLFVRPATPVRCGKVQASIPVEAK
jgi:hypothetical protein